MHEGVSEQAIPASCMCGSKVFGGVRGVDRCSVKELDEFAAR
jgi:hypothetical protein